MRTIICLILFLLWGNLSHAQTPYYWTLTDEDGLPSSEIYDLYQDTKGYLWIATNGGLCKFDGQKVTSYTIPSQEGIATTLIKESSDGTIWYKNFRKQLFFIDSRDQVQLLELPEEVKLNAQFNYVLTGVQLKLMAGSMFYKHNLMTQEWSYDTLDICYKAQFLNGILSYSAWKEDQFLYIDCFKNLYISTEQSNDHKGQFQDDIYPKEMKQLGGDSVLLLTHSKVYIDHVDNITKLDTQAVVFDHKGINRVYVAEENQVFIVTTNGVVILKKKTNTGEWAVVNHFLKDEPVGAFYKDKEGTLWIGTLGNGVHVFPSLQFSYYNVQNSALNNSNINCLEVTADSQLLIGAANGRLAQLDPISSKIDLFPPMSNYPIIDILFDAKRHQILVDAGEKYVIDVEDGQPHEIMKQLGHHSIIYKEDQLVFGGLLTLITTSLEQPVGTHFPDPALFHNQVNYISEPLNETDSIVYATLLKKRTNALWADQMDKESFWVGLDDSLFLCQRAIFIPILTPDGQAIAASDIDQHQDSTIWVTTTNQGIYGIRNKRVIHHFTVADGLPTNNCKQLTIDHHTIWIGTSQGIAKLNLLTKGITTYNQLDGLLNDDIGDLKVIRGKVWAATNKGLLSFDKSVSAVNMVPPSIRLTACYVNDSLYSFENDFALSYEENTLEFTFDAIALKSRSHYTYEYRLLGLDDNWKTQTSTTNFVRFLKLPPKQYQFEVRARNEDGILSATTTQISIYIHPPFWKTWWFISSVGLIIGGILITAIWRRYQVLQSKMATENLIAQLKMQALQTQMNPHFIFNAMSAIQNFWVNHSTKVALIYHAKFAQLMRLIFEYSNAESLLIKEEINFLKLYIDLEKIRLDHEVTVTYEIDPTLEEEEITIPPLLIQPIVENSFKHGFLHKEEAGQLIIQLLKDDTYVYCKIEDNGVGRTAAASYNTWEQATASKKNSTKVNQDRLDLFHQLQGHSSKKQPYVCLLYTSPSPRDRG